MIFFLLRNLQRMQEEWVRKTQEGANYAQAAPASQQTPASWQQQAPLPPQAPQQQQQAPAAWTPPQAPAQPWAQVGAAVLTVTL